MLPVGGCNGRRNQKCAGLAETDQKTVEQGIQVGAEQKAVEYVQPLGIARAGATPVSEHGTAKRLMADALAHQALHLGAPDGLGQFFQFMGLGHVEIVLRLIRQGMRQFGGTVQQPGQPVDGITAETPRPAKCRANSAGSKALPLTSRAR